MKLVYKGSRVDHMSIKSELLTLFVYLRYPLGHMMPYELTWFVIYAPHFRVAQHTQQMLIARQACYTISD